VESFIETLKLVHVLGPLSGFDLLSMSCSGGEASLMADMAHGRKVVFRPFTGKEVAPLKEELGEIVTIANPLDYHTFIWGNWPAMKRMFEVALAPRFDLALLVMDFPRSDRCDPDDWDQATNSFMLANAEIQTPSAVVASMQETMPEKVAHDLINVGIVPLCGLENSIIAAEVAAMIGQTWRQDLPAPLLSSQWDASESVLETLSESQSKRELSKLGLVVPKGVVIHNMNDIDTAMRGLEFPMALKALGIAHKTEMGAVKLNLKSTLEVLQALAELSSLSKSFLLEEMAPKPLAELIVGVSRDPVVGLMMTLGAGGVLAELLGDTASILLPTDETEIRSTLADLKIGRLLDGYRDSDAADIDALIANIVCIANYAVRHESELQELDVNPLFATQFGSVAVDALIVKRKMK